MKIPKGARPGSPSSYHQLPKDSIAPSSSSSSSWTSNSTSQSLYPKMRAVITAFAILLPFTPPALAVQPRPHALIPRAAAALPHADAPNLLPRAVPTTTTSQPALTDLAMPYTCADFGYTVCAPGNLGCCAEGVSCSTLSPDAASTTMMAMAGQSQPQQPMAVPVCVQPCPADATDCGDGTCCGVGMQCRSDGGCVDPGVVASFDVNTIEGIEMFTTKDMWPATTSAPTSPPAGAGPASSTVTPFTVSLRAAAPSVGIVGGGVAVGLVGFAAALL